MRKDSKISGITLISLAVTISVLIILSGVTISNLLGDDGILEKSNRQKEKSMVTIYKNRIETVIDESKLKYSTDNLSLAELNVEFNNKEWASSMRITESGTDKLQVKTNDGYFFYVTEKSIEYKGTNQEDKEEIKIPTSDEISYTPKDTNWHVTTVKEAIDYLMNN